MSERIERYSQLNRTQKIALLQQSTGVPHLTSRLDRFLMNSADPSLQKLVEGLSESVLASFPLPWSVVPNCVINQKHAWVPMVIEESSVVAAAARALKIIAGAGGFEARVLGQVKLGHVYFCYYGRPERLQTLFLSVRDSLMAALTPLAASMIERGGGPRSLELSAVDPSRPHYYKLTLKCETVDAMGANFINTLLEALADRFMALAISAGLAASELQIIMAILSNYVDESLIETSFELRPADLGPLKLTMEPQQFFERLVMAIEIAHLDPHRAVTHNKGIMNGIDAVVLATGNDFRAIEAAVHAYAAASGHYRGLTQCSLQADTLRLSLKIPLAVGVVGGVTKVHPLVQLALEILGHPSAPELAMILASVGLAQNFAALSALVTTGIQRGHMRHHLHNILQSLLATEQERTAVLSYFEHRTISQRGVAQFLDQLRDQSSSAGAARDEGTSQED